MRQPINKAMVYLAVIAIMLLNMCNSCSSDLNDTISFQEEISPKEQVVVANETSEAFNALSIAINEKASAFLANQGESPQFLGFLSKFFKAVASDVCSTLMSLTKGYDLGDALATASDASTRTGKTGCGEIWNLTIYFSNTPIINTMRNPDIITNGMKDCIMAIDASGDSINEYNIGLWHNAIIFASISNGLRFDSGKEDITHSTIESLYSVNNKISESCRFTNKVNEDTIHDLTNKYYEKYHMENAEETIQRIKVSHPEFSNEDNILSQYFRDLEQCQSLESVQKLTKIYKTEIESSLISIESRKMLLTALSVAENSASLWNTIYSNIDPDLTSM